MELEDVLGEGGQSPKDKYRVTRSSETLKSKYSNSETGSGAEVGGVGEGSHEWLESSVAGRTESRGPTGMTLMQRECGFMLSATPLHT